jgi:hypothetical protein
MLNQALAHEMFSRAQVDAMTKSLDDWLNIYTEAVLVLFIVALILVAWLTFSEARQTRAIRKLRSNHHIFKARHLLRTDPQVTDARMLATSTGGS